MHRSLVGILILLLLVVPVFAQDSTTSTNQGNAEDMAFIRFAHFAPTAPAVDVYLDGEAIAFENVAYKTITDWQPMTAGTYSLTVAPTGTSAGDAAVGPQDLTLNAGQWVTIAAAGSSENGALSATVIEEPFDQEELIPGTSYVTFVNAVTGGSTIDVIRDDVVYVPALGTLGNSDGVDASSGLRDDSGTFHFKAAASDDPDNVLVDMAETKIPEHEAVLVALVGDMASGVEMIVDSTNMAEVEMLRGELQPPGTLIEALRAQEGLAPLADAIEQAGLTETLSGEGPYTLFVPADFVLDDIPQDIMNDPDALANFLKFHVVEGNLRSQDVFNAGTLTTLQGSDLTVEVRNDGEFVNDAQIIDVNIPATNGTIHIINQALMPTSMTTTSQ